MLEIITSIKLSNLIISQIFNQSTISVRNYSTYDQLSYQVFLNIYTCIIFKTNNTKINIFHLFGVLHSFQHCTCQIPSDSFIGRGNKYIQLVKVLYCKLSTIDKQLPTFPHKVSGLNGQPQRWEVSVLPLHHL